MFKKTKITQIISLLHLNSSNSFIANALDVSRNSVIIIRSKIDELNLSKEDLEGKEDDELSSNQKQLKIWLKRLANYSSLIIDECLTNKPTDRDVKFLYELFDLRSEVNSTIFISQFDKSTWHDRLGGGVHADSIMDRISHNTYKMNLLNMKQTKQLLF